MFFGQLRKGLVDDEDIIGWRVDNDAINFDVAPAKLAAPLESSFATGRVYQYAAHCFCGRGKEVTAILPTLSVRGRANQSKVSLVH